MAKPTAARHTGWLEGDFPAPTRAAKIVPMPKRFCVSGPAIRTLATAAGSGILTDVEASTFAVRKQARNLPVIHKLFLDSELHSLGYTQRRAKGNSSELHFITPDLKLVRTVRVPDACTGFTSKEERWMVACRDGRLHCFDRSGDAVWVWKAPRDRHFPFPAFLVAANEEGIYVAESFYLYVLSSNGEQWGEWKLPHPQEGTRRLSIPVGGDSSPALALRTLGLKEDPKPEEIRQAHRRMARLTHPDLNPGDETASGRFRSVQQAYECLQNKTSPGAGRTVTITISLGMNGFRSTRITTLTAQGSVVGIGTSQGEAYLLDATGRIQACHSPLGRQCICAVLLRGGRLDAAFCSPRLYRFGSGSPVASENLEEYFVNLAPHGDDVLVCGWKTMWLFGADALLKGRMRCERKIDGIAASSRETLVLAGSLMAIPHG